ncbi:chromate transporter [Evansella caseinilytica]|uniref:Chromate transporter n=1 Tax=Evansella caseinilytica TaxID=1503961 RepID=A0A1H3PCZ9_9BACI|nr:chromate transporter [Evansella caseinilytica]SDY98938.1 chromate transporter [Evansella caseinilytica]
MKTNWKLCLLIFWEFFKIGPVTFGGGYAVIPMIEHQMVRKKNWLSREEATDVFALAGSVPGAVAINSAMFIGQRLAGVFGAVAAMTGMMFPTFLFVMILSILFYVFQGNPYVEAAFIGIRPAIVALIVYAGIRIYRTAVFDKSTMTIAVMLLLALLIIHFHPLAVILCGGLAGISIMIMKKKLGLAVNLEKKQPKAKKEGGLDRAG